jgi:hypothetical protein
MKYNYYMKNEIEREVYSYIKFGLNIKDDFKLEKVPEILKSQYRNLPITQSILKVLTNQEREVTEISHKLFDLLRKSSDKSSVGKERAGTNGVLIPSISEGYLECAGRVGIASTVLRELSINHFITGAPGHTFLIIEKRGGRWIYADYNQETYFLFTDNALSQIEDYDKSVEISLEIQKPSTYYLNYGTPYTHFYALSPESAMLFSFYSNLSALSVDPEYVGFTVKNVEKVRSRLRELKYTQTSDLGEEYFEFDQKSPDMDKEIERWNLRSKKKVKEFLQESEIEFIEGLSNEIQKSEPYRLMYIDPTNRGDVEKYAKSVYENFSEEHFKGVF